MKKVRMIPGVALVLLTFGCGSSEEKNSSSFASELRKINQDGSMSKLEFGVERVGISEPPYDDSGFVQAFSSRGEVANMPLWVLNHSLDAAWNDQTTRVIALWHNSQSLYISVVDRKGTEVERWRVGVKARAMSRLFLQGGDVAVLAEESGNQSALYLVHFRDRSDPTVVRVSDTTDFDQAYFPTTTRLRREALLAALPDIYTPEEGSGLSPTGSPPGRGTLFSHYGVVTGNPGKPMVAFEENGSAFAVAGKDPRVFRNVNSKWEVTSLAKEIRRQLNTTLGEDEGAYSVEMNSGVAIFGWQSGQLPENYFLIEARGYKVRIRNGAHLRELESLE